MNYTRLTGKAIFEGAGSVSPTELGKAYVKDERFYYLDNSGFHEADIKGAHFMGDSKD